MTFLALAEGGAPLDLEAQTLEGRPFDVRALEGKVVLIDFWAVWCSPCIKAFPKLSALHERYKDRAFMVVGIALHSGSHTEVAAFLEDHSVSYPMLVGDADLAERFRVIGFPTYLLLGRDGRVIERFVGESDNFEPHILQALNKKGTP